MSSKRRNWQGRKGRKLSFEGLEPRRMLATYTVRLDTDAGDETVANSLSWAIEQANTIAGGPHTINFQLNSGGSQIQVTGQVTTIKAPMTIDGTLPGGAPVLLLKTGMYAGNGLEIDGSLTGGGTIEIRDLAISSFERNGIQVLAMGANDVVRIDNTSVHHNTMVGIRVGQTMVASSRVLITGNDIWANGTAGIIAESAASVTQSNQHSISGNNIGLGGSLGNFGPGVLLGVNARNYSVNGNTFNGNTGDGISVSMDAKGQNDLTGNDFLGNGGIPIDINDNGPTGNDENDTDAGPNNLLNYPVVDEAGVSFDGTNWKVPITIDAEGTLNSSQYAIEIYKVNPATKQYTHVYSIGNKTFPTSGDLKFTQSIPANLGGGVTLSPGDRITALLMNNTTGNALRYNTSEFPETPIVLDAAAPRVLDVRLSGVQPNGNPWIRAPYSFQQLVPTGRQLDSIFTAGVNKIEVVFDESVVIEGNDFALTGSNGPIAHSNFVYTSATRTGTWTYASPLEADKYVFAQVGSVTDAVGKSLDGEWDRPVDAMDVLLGPTDKGPDWNNDQPRAFPSGIGTPGGDFRLHFAYLPGDYNRDGIVLNQDAGPLATSQKSDLETLADGNGDDVVDASDAAVVNAAIAAGKTRLTAGRFRGDYNDNEIVDNFMSPHADDYKIWKTTFESTTDLRADGNANGVVDAADYTIWRDNLIANSYSAWSAGPSGGGGGSGGVPIFDPLNVPRVANVTISGSSSTHAPFSFNGPNDSTDYDGSGIQLRTVPVGGADTISITFSEDVNIVASDLSLVGLRTYNRPVLASFSYDVGTMTATWWYTGWALADHYAIRLRDTVTDVEGKPLDGEWVNPTSLSTTNALVSEFPSGNGIAGGDFQFIFTLLPGDANLDLSINPADQYFIQWGMQNALFTQGDFTGNGIVNEMDAAIYYPNLGTSLQTLILRGDLNGDWAVDELDADILWNNRGLANPTPAMGDLNGNGVINSQDLDLIFAQYGLDLSVVA